MTRILKKLIVDPLCNIIKVSFDETFGLLIGQGIVNIELDPVLPSVKIFVEELVAKRNDS